MLEICIRRYDRGIGGSIPRRVKRGFDVHNFVTHLEEMLSRQRLGEEVRNVAGSGNKRYANLSVLHALPNEEVTPFDVFHPGMIFRIV